MDPISGWPVRDRTSIRSGIKPAHRGVGVVLILLLIGCSGGEGRVPVYPVKGKITVLGEAPEGALVIFNPVQAGGVEIRPSARVARDGSFTVTTYDADDGAPAGDYVVTIQWNKLVKRGNDYAAGPNVVPPSYAARDKSPWKVTVAAGPNDLAPRSIDR